MNQGVTEPANQLSNESVTSFTKHLWGLEQSSATPFLEPPSLEKCDLGLQNVTSPGMALGRKYPSLGGHWVEPANANVYNP